MSRYAKGQRVIATEDLGGFFTDSVPKGTTGVVVESPMFGNATVHFEWPGFFGNNESKKTVADNQIAPA